MQGFTYIYSEISPSSIGNHAHLVRAALDSNTSQLPVVNVRSFTDKEIDHLYTCLLE